MSANITAASLDQSLDLYEANNSVSQIEKIAQKNAQVMADTIQSGEALLEQAQALTKSFNLKASPNSPKINPELNPPLNGNIEEQVAPIEQTAEKDPDWKLF